MKGEEDMEQAVLFSRVSSKAQVSKAKFEQTLAKAKDYCEGGYANKTKTKYMLCEKQFTHVGSAFSKDIREGEVWGNSAQFGQWKVQETSSHYFCECGQIRSERI